VGLIGRMLGLKKVGTTFGDGLRVIGRKVGLLVGGWAIFGVGLTDFLGVCAVRIGGRYVIGRRDGLRVLTTTRLVRVGVGPLLNWTLTSAVPQFRSRLKQMRRDGMNSTAAHALSSPSTTAAL